MNKSLVCTYVRDGLKIPPFNLILYEKVSTYVWSSRMVGCACDRRKKIRQNNRTIEQ